LNSLIVPIDFSEIAKNALLYAIEFARQTKAKVVVLHVAKKNIFSGLLSNSNEISSEQAEVKILDLKRVLEPKIQGVQVNFMIKEGGFSQVLEDIVEDEEAEMIIMGTRGESKVRRVIWGSNTLDVIDKVDCPLLVVPENFSFKSINRIIYATDFKFLEKFTLNTLKKIALAFDSEVLITNVITERDKRRYSKDEQKEIRRENKMLSGVRHEFKRVYRSSVVSGINYYIEKKKDIDLITLIPRKHNSLYEYLFKSSTTKEIALHPELPVLVLPDQ
tara:strand:- start:775 stop:1599 length:825 start_codon:yes stop_codon:yes gene_type:complete